MKSCVNGNCPACQKKTSHKEIESFCSLCGNPLAYVCKDCFTQLSNGDEKYCVRCRAKHDDQSAAIKKRIGTIGSGALAVAGLSIKYGKKAIETIKTII